jgi:hypothetical protein
MKWTFRISIDVNKGREKVFSLRKFLPFFQRLHDEGKNRVNSCFSKTRFNDKYGAESCAWFKRHPDIRHAAYECPICDGWHITTKEEWIDKKNANA